MIEERQQLHAAEPPDFSGWTTSRIQFLLTEYETNLGSVRSLFGRRHPDTLMYERWVEAMKKELGCRK